VEDAPLFFDGKFLQPPAKQGRLFSPNRRKICCPLPFGRGSELHGRISPMFTTVVLHRFPYPDGLVTSEMAMPEIGQIISHYKIKEKISSGDMDTAFDWFE
jgi:hypothetical protein